MRRRLDDSTMMIKGYDSGVVLREDIIGRVWQYYAEIEQPQKEIDEVKERLGIVDNKVKKGATCLCA